MSLSMHTADDWQSHPTTGIPETANMPWMVPSSQNLPCIMGRITSMSRYSRIPPVSVYSFPSERSSDSGIFFVPSVHLSGAIRAGSS